MPEVQQQPPVEGGPFGAVVVFDVIGTLFSTERAAEAFQILGMAADAFELALADALRDAFAMSLAGGYAPFAQVLEASLRRIAERHGLPAADPAPVIDAMQRLDPVEGAVDAVTRLNESGVRLVTLTNSSVGSTRALLGRAGIVERFDALLSCDEIEVFKPHPRTYELARRQAVGQIWMVASHAWDIQGAGRVGFKTAWVAGLERRYLDSYPGPDVRAEDLRSATKDILARQR